MSPNQNSESQPESKDIKTVEKKAGETTTTETHDEPGKAAVHTEKTTTEKSDPKD